VPATVAPSDAPPSTLWEAPTSLADRDLFNGPWGAPRRRARTRTRSYTYVRQKRGGTNPGWSCRIRRDVNARQQAPANDRARKGRWRSRFPACSPPSGITNPRVLPVVRSRCGTHRARTRSLADAFDLHEATLIQNRGEWAWQRNPFVGTRPYQGLLVTLLLFNSFDLKNSKHRSTTCGVPTIASSVVCRARPGRRARQDWAARPGAEQS